mgnify:CR=1 FL=1
MTLIERFLKYVSFDTQSDDNSGVTPSTPKQMVFAQYLRSELEQLALKKFHWTRMVIFLLPCRQIPANRYQR